MFNIGSGELALIAVVALLILGPKRLPELARGIGKFMREFRRQTDEVRGVVEREFYRMDHEPLPPGKDGAKPPEPGHADVPLVRSVKESVAVGQPEPDALPPADDVSSQLTAGMPVSKPAEPEPAPAAPTEAPPSKS